MSDKLTGGNLVSFILYQAQLGYCIEVSTYKNLSMNMFLFTTNATRFDLRITLFKNSKA